MPHPTLWFRFFNDRITKVISITLLTLTMFIGNSSYASSFTIKTQAKLDVALLDYCWQHRENLANQKIIADYLMQKPDVASDFTIAWKTARLVYFIGNYGLGFERFVNTEEGVELFDYGVRAGKIAQKLQPDAVEGYYWYAVDLGSYGLAKGILASAVHAKDGMNALNQANIIDPEYQWYGSDRILGRYYQELPKLFGGSSSKAEALLTNAVKLAPNYKNNVVILGRFYLQQGDYQKALALCQKASTMPALDGKYEEMRYTREANECVQIATKKQ